MESAGKWTSWLRSSVPTDSQSLALYALLLLAIWLYTALLSGIAFPSLTKSHILLLIAHPDDEAMFFSPTLLNLTSARRRNVVKILCLSNGNADGLGAVREKELRKSAQLLGIDERHVVCLDDPDLQDSMTATWPETKVSAVLSRFLLPPDYNFGPTSAAKSTGTSASNTTRSRSSKQTAASKDGAPPHTHADIILTFDRHGVSSHPNHISLYHGALSWVKQLKQAHPGWACPVSLYTLASIPLWRKYLGVVDVAPSVLAGILGALGRTLKQQLVGTGLYSAEKSPDQVSATSARPSWLLFVSGPGSILKAQRAMYRAHKSQMRWFRWGWIGVGRYMGVNSLRRAA